MQRYFITLFIALLCAATATAQPKYEIRATWLTTLGGMDWPRQKANNQENRERQQQELCRLLDKLQRAHINTVLFQTRLRGDVVYPSSLEGFAESLTGQTGRNPGYDPLAFAVSECHKRGMELHAWIVTIPIGNTRQVKLQGEKSVVRQQRSLCKQHQGSWYLDPGNPKTADYLSAIVREVVSRYDIDGIHLDYIRYPEQAERFPDNDTFHRYGKGKKREEWRRENITRIVRRIYTDVKALKPWVKVSSSPVGKYRDTRRYASRGWNAYHIVCQEAQQWLAEGIHDALFPMMYFRGNQFYPFAVDWKEHANGRWIVPGLGIYFLSPAEQDWPLDEVVRQIYFARRLQLAGQAYFRNRFLLGNTKGLLDELQENLYTAPALVPPMTWTDSIPPATPACPTCLPDENGHTLLGWNTAQDDSGQPVTYRLYASDNYPVDTEDPRHLVEPRLTDTCYTYRPAQPWLSKRYFAIVSVDRCGNESRPLALNTPGSTDLPLLGDGGTLCLPPSAAENTVIVCLPTGETVLRTAYRPKISIDALAAGMYFVKLLTPQGKEEWAGSILKTTLCSPSKGTTR